MYHHHNYPGTLDQNLIMNKPCLSINDILKWTDGKSGQLSDMLIELVTLKINKK